MEQKFNFALGQTVITPHGFKAKVTSAGVNRSGVFYWLSYVDLNGVVQEVCHDESELSEE